MSLTTTRFAATASASFMLRGGFCSSHPSTAFDCLAGFRVARTAVVRFELEPIESRRIVARRDHHPADGPLVLGRVGNRRRGRRLSRQHDLKAVAREDFRRTVTEAI